MKNTLRLLMFGVILLTGISASAQNEPLYSQYIFNKLVINPAYAGSRGVISFNTFYRKQWMDINGSPETFSFSIHSPLANDHYNLGLTVYNDRIGAFNQTGVQGIYAYAFNVGNGKLGLGVQGGVQYYQTNLSEFDEAILSGDPAAMDFGETEWVPVAGAGIYYHNRSFAIGFSVPQLFTNDIYERTHTFQSRHYYLTADYMWRITDNFRIKPSVLFKTAENIKSQLDANLNIIVLNAFSVGAGYRTDESYVFMGQLFLNNIVETKKVQLILGYAYDYSNKHYRANAGGVHEAMLTMEFLTRHSNVASPRYF